jgi:uncharacterized protein YrzB (UPF0473 family)
MDNTTTMLVYFDANGTAVHFGEWVNFYNYDENKNPIIVNPIPLDFTSKEVEVVTNPDGSRSVVSPKL